MDFFLEINSKNLKHYNSFKNMALKVFLLWIFVNFVFVALFSLDDCKLEKDINNDFIVLKIMCWNLENERKIFWSQGPPSIFFFWGGGGEGGRDRES